MNGRDASGTRRTARARRARTNPRFLPAQDTPQAVQADGSGEVRQLPARGRRDSGTTPRDAA